jgi:hypothetical protein
MKGRLFGLALALAASPAFAVIDVSEAVSSVGDAVTAITAVGAALIGAAAVVMALRWVKAMFF